MPGWKIWEARGYEAFNSLFEPIRLRIDDDGRARVRFWPGIRHQNPMGNVHGGALMAFVDMALFAGAHELGVRPVAHALTLEAGIQFIDGGKIGQPIDAVVELLRETGRMAFIRGLLVQEGRTISAFTGTFRKMRPSK